MDAAGTGTASEFGDVLARRGMDGQARRHAPPLPVEEHGVRHVAVPVPGMIGAIHAVGIEFVISLGRRGEGAASARTYLVLLAAGGNLPVMDRRQHLTTIL